MFTRFSTISLAFLISAVAEIQSASVLAQQIKPSVAPLVLSQVRIYTDISDYTRVIRAESGPDNRGRWRFYRPDNVSREAMEAQGCTDVGTGGASWRCPRPAIRVEVDDESPYDNGRRYRNRNTLILRAESGPDDRRRWRFYKPDNVSRDAMQAQGCTNVGTRGASWRCPRPTIRVQVNNGRPYYRRRWYDTMRLRAESGPDDRGRWRFYKPDNVSREAMEAQGCTEVRTRGASWRCPRPTIRVEVNDDR
jgi:hypothetical protein